MTFSNKKHCLTLFKEFLYFVELRFEINENKYKKVSSKLVSTCPIATVANAASYNL